MHACMYACIYIYTLILPQNACMYLHIHACMYLHIYACMYLRIYTHIAADLRTPAISTPPMRWALESSNVTIITHTRAHAHTHIHTHLSTCSYQRPAIDFSAHTLSLTCRYSHVDTDILGACQRFLRTTHALGTRVK